MKEFFFETECGHQEHKRFSLHELSSIDNATCSLHEMVAQPDILPLILVEISKDIGKAVLLLRVVCSGSTKKFFFSQPA